MKVKHYIFITIVLVILFYIFIFLFTKFMDKISYFYDYNLIAEKYLKQGELNKAIEVYKKRISSCEGSIRRYKTDKDRRENFETLLRQDCKSLGRILINHKLFDEAISYYLKIFPDVETFQYIGEVYLEKGDLKESAESFKIAISQDFRNFDDIVALYKKKIENTKDLNYKIYLAILYYNAFNATKTKKYLDSSLKILKEVVKEKPDDWLVLRYLGMVFINTKDDKNAVVYLSQALKSNPDDYVSYFYLEKCDNKKIGFNPFEKFNVDKTPSVMPFMDEKNLSSFKNFWGNYTRKYTFNISEDNLHGIIIAKSTKVFGIGALISIQIGKEKIYRYIGSNTFEPCEFEFSNLQKGENEFSISMLNDLKLKSSILKEDRNLFISNIYMIKKK